MADSNPSPRSRQFGPIQIINTSLGRQLLGYVLALIGIDIFWWAVQSSVISSTIIHTAIGMFVFLNGVYLGGVRFR